MLKTMKKTFKLLICSQKQNTHLATGGNLERSFLTYADGIKINFSFLIINSDFGFSYRTTGL